MRVYLTRMRVADELTRAHSGHAPRLRKLENPKKTRGGLRSGSYVIVDFVFDRGRLSISIKNIGSRPAFGVRVEFSHRLMGVEGTVEGSALALYPCA